MDLYQKIKEFVAINPAPIHLGEYLKDASVVHKIFGEMMGLESITSQEEIAKRENEMNAMMTEILGRWKKA